MLLSAFARKNNTLNEEQSLEKKVAQVTQKMSELYWKKSRSFNVAQHVF